MLVETREAEVLERKTAKTIDRVGDGELARGDRPQEPRHIGRIHAGRITYVS